MLHNTGQFGSDVPMNMNSQTNMTPMNDRLGIDSNVNNMSKIAHQPPQPVQHYNLPDYGGYGLNMNTNLSHFQNYHPIGFPPSNSQAPMHTGWQNNLLPMNLNMHNEHMLGYPYSKPDSLNEYKDHMNKTLNIPQVQTKAFHKQMGMDIDNYHSFNPNFRQYPDFNLHLNSRHKPETNFRKIDQNIGKERIETPSPLYLDQNIDVSKPEQMINNLARPYQNCELNLSMTKNENGDINNHQSINHLDLSMKPKKVDDRPAATYHEKIDNTPPKNVEQTHSDGYLNLTKSQKEDTLSSDFQYSDLGNRFLKDQDSRRRSLENTVKMIENILSHSSNSRKPSSYYQDSPNQAQDKTTINTHDSEASQNSSNDNSNSKPNSPSPSNVDNPTDYSHSETSQDCTNVNNDNDTINDDETEKKCDELDNTKVPDESNNENKNNDKGESDDYSSDTEDVKPPLLKENYVDNEQEMKMENTVVIKVEVIPSIVDLEHLNPFHRDIFGIQNEDVSNNDIIDSDNSVNVAKEIMRSGASVKGAFFECPHCNLYFNHPKRFLIHTKWHSFGLTNEKRMELQKEKEMRKNMRKEARVVARMKESEVTDVNTPGRKFSCKECDKVFSAKASLKNHRQRYHPTRSRDCKICGKNLSGWSALRAHLATHTSDSGYQCSDCPKRFKHPHSLAKHKDTHLEKTHACAQCPKKFGSAALLNVHMKTHERALRGATFRCTYCAKGFFESYSLQVHERTHRNERPYLCEICNTSFGTNSSLKRHLKVSHSTSKPFECSTCHRSFISEAIRDRHSIRNHGDPEEFKFRCKQCPCKYLKLKDLRKHTYKVHPKGRRKKKAHSDSE